jgi:MYXO-CTERM domain-containing protein
MTTDPLFSFNGELDDISNIHTAERVIECSAGISQFQAPWRVELPQVGVIRGTAEDAQMRTWPAVTSDQPSNVRILQLGERGEGDVATDNTKLLLDLNGGAAAPIAGGSPGSGGSSATGGAPARPSGGTNGGSAPVRPSGGSTTTGGKATTGGTATAGRAATSGGSAPAPTDTGSGSDDGCAMGGTQSSGGWAALFGLAALTGLARRRRAR